MKTKVIDADAHPREHLIRLLLARKGDEVNGVSKLFHSLQTATRALQDGRDEEYVVCALFHDIAGGISPKNHAHAGAEILRPYISVDNYFMLWTHDEVQKENWEGRPHRTYTYPGFARTVEFCDKYDFPSFDPNYPTAPLGQFMSIIKQVIK